MKRGDPASLMVTALLVLIWGTTWAAIRIGLEGIPPLTGVALRFAIAAVVLLAVGFARRVPFGRAPHEKPIWAANALLSFCVSYVVVYWCEQWVPSGLGAVLFSTFPLFVAILAHFFLESEKLRPRGAVGTLIGFAGVAVIFSEDFTLLGGPKVALASAIMLISPFVSAISNVIIKKWGREIHPVSLAAVPMGVAAGIVGAAAAVFERGRTVVLDGASMGALLYLAVFGSAVTFGLYYWLLSRHSATRVSMIAYLCPVVAVLVGAVFLDEPVTLRTVIGSAMVIAGVGLAVGGGHAAGGRAGPT